MREFNRTDSSTQLGKPVNVFVIMKFSEHMDNVYRTLIKTPLEREGFHVGRSDDPGASKIIHEKIYDRIIQNLWDADYVIADLTVLNGNVYYELGIAHTLNKRTIQISQHLEIPSDIKSQMVHRYAVDDDPDSDLTSILIEILRRAAQGRWIFSNIVEDFLMKTSRTIVTDPPARS